MSKDNSAAKSLKPIQISRNLFAGWAGKKKDIVWLTDGQEWCDYYGRTINIQAESIDDLIAALKQLKESKD